MGPGNSHSTEASACLDQAIKDGPAQCTNKHHVKNVQYVEPQEDHIYFSLHFLRNPSPSDTITWVRLVMSI